MGSCFRPTKARVGVALFVGTVLASIGLADPPGGQTCRCIVQTSSGPLVTSERQCPDDTFCGCKVLKSSDGSILGLKAICQFPPPPAKDPGSGTSPTHDR